MLRHSRRLGLKRFIFASSLTVSKFVDPNTILTEKTPADATFPYAVSKAKGEEMVQEASRYFPTLSVRLAAIFDDWCHYCPLDATLRKWLSSDWDCHILVGKGQAAVPYLHISNLIRFFSSVMMRTESLPETDILIASPKGCTTHEELFRSATRYSYFQSVNPLFFPCFLARIGIVQRNLWGGVKGCRPFEQLWMLKYIDKQMQVDPTYTRSVLRCAPNPRYHILRRLPFLITNLKRMPDEWKHVNRPHKYDPILVKQNLQVYHSLAALKSQIIHRVADRLSDPVMGSKFLHYRELPSEELRKRIERLYQMLETDIRTGDRTNLLDYTHLLALDRIHEGFPLIEVCTALETTAEYLVDALREKSKLVHFEQRIQEEVAMTIQMAVDEIIDTYECRNLGGDSCLAHEEDYAVDRIQV